MMIENLMFACISTTQYAISNTNYSFFFHFLNQPNYHYTYIHIFIYVFFLFMRIVLFFYFVKKKNLWSLNDLRFISWMICVESEPKKCVSIYLINSCLSIEFGDHMILIIIRFRAHDPHLIGKDSKIYFYLVIIC